MDGHVGKDDDGFANFTGMIGAAMFLYAGKNEHEENGNPEEEEELAVNLINDSIELGTNLSLMTLLKRAVDFNVPARVFFSSVVDTTYESIVELAG